jgi:hypothetical protein
MVRRVMLFSLSMVLVLAGMVSVTSAAQNVANTSQKGSLLIWPKVIVYYAGTNNFLETEIYIGNDYYQDVWVKCYWVDGNQNIEDFMFRLSPNQPVYFSATYGTDDDGIMSVPPFAVDGNATGELKCWAVNEAGTEQISFNHLYGNAWIYGTPPGFEDVPYLLGDVLYNAYAFAAKQPFGATVGTAGALLLNGTTGYDACPQYLVSNFWPSKLLTDPYGLDLTLVPCKQDLRQDRTPTCTKAKFDIWNANETKFTGAYQCIKCWYEGFLREIGQTDPYWGSKLGFGGDKFVYSTLHTWAARFRVQGVASAVCKNKFLKADPLNPGKLLDICPEGAKPSPLLGLLLYTFTDELFTHYMIDAGHTPYGAGLDGSGFIYWDPQTPPEEAPKK